MRPSWCVCVLVLCVVVSVGCRRRLWLLLLRLLLLSSFLLAALDTEDVEEAERVEVEEGVGDEVACRAAPGSDGAARSLSEDVIAEWSHSSRSSSHYG